MGTRTPRGRRRAPRSGLALRWLAVGGICLVALLYYRPVRSYVETRATVERRSVEVRSLETQRRKLERRLAESAGEVALTREARKLGLVRPGERLFIVKGIRQWRGRLSSSTKR